MNKIFLIISASSLLLAPFALTQAHEMNAVNTPGDTTVTVPGDRTAIVPKRDVSDIDLARKVKVAISEDKVLAPFSSTVFVQSEKGVITLSGNVDSQKTKTDIESKVKNVSGVNKVVNNIEIQKTVRK